MRVTLTPTAPPGPHRNPEVSISNGDTDDLDIHQALDLIRSALLAWGYAESTIDDAIGRE